MSKYVNLHFHSYPILLYNYRLPSVSPNHKLAHFTRGDDLLLLERLLRTASDEIEVLSGYALYLIEHSDLFNSW
jgi:hypothetical protein